MGFLRDEAVREPPSLTAFAICATRTLVPAASFTRTGSRSAANKLTKGASSSSSMLA